MESRTLSRNPDAVRKRTARTIEKAKRDLSASSSNMQSLQVQDEHPRYASHRSQDEIQAISQNA